jgi:phosphatidylglycerophosphatase A
MAWLARAIATWFGCGYSPKAPGTVGTLGTLPLCYVLSRQSTLVYWAATIVITALGVWASTRYAADAGEEDPQAVVIDEVSGTLIAVGLALGGGPLAALLAVVLFRVFDIWKPGPIDNAQNLPRGWGIMADDVLAGLAAGLVAAALTPWLPRLG